MENPLFFKKGWFWGYWKPHYFWGNTKISPPYDKPDLQGFAPLRTRGKEDIRRDHTRTPRRRELATQHGAPKRGEFFKGFFVQIWVFPKIVGKPKMDGLWWKTLLKWMIWGYHHLKKHPSIHQGKNRWHSYHVLVLYKPCINYYILRTVPCTLTMGYIFPTQTQKTKHQATSSILLSNDSQSFSTCFFCKGFVI